MSILANTKQIEVFSIFSFAFFPVCRSRLIVAEYQNFQKVRPCLEKSVRKNERLMMLKKMLLVALVTITTMGADWSLNTVPDVTLGGSAAGSGSCLLDASYTVSILWRDNIDYTTLCSHGGSTHYMQMSWDKDFSPASDYNPPGQWALTTSQTHLVYRLTAGTFSDEKEFECKTAP